MTTTENFTQQTIHSASLGKRMFQGSIPSLLLICIFLYSAGAGKPEWGDYWMIQPILVGIFAGAMGGLVYYFLDGMRSQGGWNTIIANVLSVIIYIIGIWMGMVLGLSGTYWN